MLEKTVITADIKTIPNQSLNDSMGVGIYFGIV